jgi:hypothetical protein
MVSDMEKWCGTTLPAQSNARQRPFHPGTHDGIVPSEKDTDNVALGKRL